MKKFTLIGAFLLAALSYGQVNVILDIHHKLAYSDFSYEHPCSNNLGNSFSFTRAEYYISKISLVHDGGQKTAVTDKYLMVKANEPLSETLGSYNITNLEGIELGIGVDYASNHLDPSTQPKGHPLWFQGPSMHWGWASGYRFVAFEGLGGAGGDQIWQLHALGDKNYGHAIIPTTGEMINGDLVISLAADCEKALRGITVSGNLNYHGEDQQAPMIMQNFQNHVYTDISGKVGLHENSVLNFSLSPNPSQGQTTLRLVETQAGAELVIFDVSGKIVWQTQLSNQTQILLPNLQTGVYQVALLKNGNRLTSKKLISL